MSKKSNRGKGPRPAQRSRSQGGGTPVPPRAGKARAQAQPIRRPAPRGRQAAQAERRRRTLIATGSVVAVLAVVAVVVALGLSSGGASASPRTPVPAGVVSAFSSVPTSVLVDASQSVGSKLSPAQTLDGAALTAGGKPEILYIGAEFCPYCAAERWALVLALSHFGSFTKLSETRSGVHDGDIATFSFYGSHYTSPYLTFTPVETFTNKVVGKFYSKLQTPTPTEASLWNTLLHGQETFPFVDIGGRYLIKVAQYSFPVLSNLSFSQISADVGSNATTQGVEIDAAAAAVMKYVCDTDGQVPATTCDALSSVTAPVSSSTSSGDSSAG